MKTSVSQQDLATEAIAEVAMPVACPSVETIDPPIDGVEKLPSMLLQQFVLAVTEVALAAASRCADLLPGIVESVENVVVYVAGTPKSRYAHFLDNAWRGEGGWVPEIVLNATHLDRPTEDILTTILHEIAHAYAASQGINETSRDGRYHNRRFAEIAIQLGTHVVHDDRIGHRTRGLSPAGRERYADLLHVLGDAVTLVRDPKRSIIETGPRPPTTGGEDISSNTAAKRPSYVMAICECRNKSGRPAVTLRVATGCWRPGTTHCWVCGTDYVDPAATTINTDPNEGCPSLDNPFPSEEPE